MQGVRRGVYLTTESAKRVDEVAELTGLALGKMLEMFVYTHSDDEILKIKQRWEEWREKDRAQKNALRKRLAKLPPETLMELLKKVENDGESG